MKQQLTPTGQACLMAAIVAFACGVGAIVTGIMANQEQTIASLGKSIPQKIRAQDLAEKGPGDNVHVILTDFEFGNDFAATKPKNGTRWSTVFVPIYPKGEAETGKKFAVAIKSSHVNDTAELDAMAASPAIEGVIINAIQGQGSDLYMFKQKFPDMNMKLVWLIEEGREFPTASTIDRKFLYCSILAGLAVVSLFVTVWLAMAANREPKAAEY